MEYEAHNKGVGALVMLPEGTLLSGGDRDRRVAAWDSLQNYKKITEVKVWSKKLTFVMLTHPPSESYGASTKIQYYNYKNYIFSCRTFSVALGQSTRKDLAETTATSILERWKTIF